MNRRSISLVTSQKLMAIYDVVAAVEEEAVQFNSLRIYIRSFIALIKQYKLPICFYKTITVGTLSQYCGDSRTKND